jgi:hypothetical protein
VISFQEETKAYPTVSIPAIINSSITIVDLTSIPIFPLIATASRAI